MSQIEISFPSKQTMTANANRLTSAHISSSLSSSRLVFVHVLTDPDLFDQFVGFNCYDASSRNRILLYESMTSLRDLLITKHNYLYPHALDRFMRTAAVQGNLPTSPHASACLEKIYKAYLAPDAPLDIALDTAVVAKHPTLNILCEIVDITLETLYVQRFPAFAARFQLQLVRFDAAAARLHDRIAEVRRSPSIYSLLECSARQSCCTDADSLYEAPDVSTCRSFDSSLSGLTQVGSMGSSYSMRSKYQSRSSGASTIVESRRHSRNYDYQTEQWLVKSGLGDMADLLLTGNSDIRPSMPCK